MNDMNDRHNVETKVFEIRDAATCIPVMVTRFTAQDFGALETQEQRLIRRGGWGDQISYIMVGLACDGGEVLARSWEMWRLPEGSTYWVAMHLILGTFGQYAMVNPEIGSNWENLPIGAILQCGLASGRVPHLQSSDV